MEQLNLLNDFFDGGRPEFKIENKIRLIELFAGVGSQAMALERLGADFEHYRVVEFDKYAIASYNAIHGTDFPTMDITEIKGEDLGIVDTDKYCYLLTYSFPCGLAGTKIKTSDGYKNIEDVKVGDMVLTHNNRYCKVKKTMSRKVGSYNNIKALGCGRLQLTDNHPMYVLRNNEIQWVKVKDLNTKTDKVCFNVNTESKPIPADDNILWLVGRYVADGHINKYSYNSVNFAVGLEKVDEFISHIPLDMKDRFKTFDKPGIKDFRIADHEFQEFCLEFGNGANNKVIPSYILNMPKDKVKIFLDGYFSGDGHYVKEKNMMMFCTTSKELFLGLQELIAKVYGTICSCYIRQDNRKESFSDTYNCQFTIKPSRNSQQKRIGNQIFTPIRGIEHIEDEVMVYNFEVDEDNSYTCENIVVHNCTDLSVAGKQEGMSKGSGTRSGLLWEVERLLKETKELPQVLVMENVPQVHGEKFKADFLKWLDFLTDLGYTNFHEDLNARYYGVPQNRDRTIMVSLLGNYKFKMPKPIPLYPTMNNLLEDEVDDRYFLNSEKANKLIEELLQGGKLDNLPDKHIHIPPDVVKLLSAYQNEYNEAISVGCDLSVNCP